MAKTSAALRWTEHWKPASALLDSATEERFPPLPVPGIPSLFGRGLARGSIAEISGKRSAGVTTLSLHVLAEASRRGETCAVVDLHDSFDPASAEAASVQLDRLVWVRCGGNAEHAMRAADLILHAGGFGLVLLHLSDANARVLNRIPLSYWFRFLRVVEHTPTVLLVCSDSPQVKSCASATVQLSQRRTFWAGHERFALLRGLEVSARLKATAVPPQLLSIQTVA